MVVHLLLQQTTAVVRQKLPPQSSHKQNNLPTCSLDDLYRYRYPYRLIDIRCLCTFLNETVVHYSSVYHDIGTDMMYVPV